MKRSRAAVVAAIALTGVAGACVDADVDEAEPSPTTDAFEVVSPSDGVLELGQSIETARGNVVTVVDVEPDGAPTRLAALVDVCTSDSGSPALVSRRSFVLQGTSRPVVAAVEPEERAPALATVALEADSCTRGWIAFEIGDDRPLAVALLSRTAAPVRWRIDLSEAPGDGEGAQG